MRSFTHGNPLVLIALTGLFFFVLSYSGVAQDVVDTATEIVEDVAMPETPPFTPDFSIVAPFDGDEVSQSLLVIIVPDFPDAVTDTEVSFSSLDSSNEKIDTTSQTITAGDNWTTSFDTTKISNGPAQIDIHVCVDQDCVDETIRVMVNNPPSEPLEETKTSPSETPPSETSPDETPPGETPVEPVPVEPIPVEPTPAEPMPIEPVPVEPIPIPLVNFTPSNFAGAFSIYDAKSHDTVATSSGDPIELATGNYSADFTFVSGMVHFIAVSEFSISSDATGVFFFDDAVTQRFSIGEESFQPIQSVGLDIGVDSQGTQLELYPLEEGTELVWCTNWNRNAATCEDGTILPHAEKPSIDTKENQIVLVIVKSLGKTNPGAGEMVTVLPSNVTGQYWLADDVGNIITSAGLPMDVPQQMYDVNIELSASAFSLIRLKTVTLDHNGTIAEVQSVSTNPRGVHVTTLTIDYPFESGYFYPTPDYNTTLIQKCSSWDSVLQSCVGEWESSGIELSRGVTAYQFFPNFVDESESETPEIPISERQTTRDLIDQLKKLFKNRQFYISDLDGAESHILSTMFSSMEVSLECTPAPGKIKPPATDTNVTDVNVMDVNVTDVNANSNNKDENNENDENGTLSSAPHYSAKKSFVLSFAEDDVPFPADENGDGGNDIRGNGTDSNGADSNATDTTNTVLIPNDSNSTEIILPVDNSLSVGNHFDSDWEETFPEKTKGQQSEGLLSCDGVSLMNNFLNVNDAMSDENTTYLGDSRPYVKQTLTLTNLNNTPTTRLVNVRFTFPSPKIFTDKKEIEPFSQYQIIKTEEKDVVVDVNADTNTIVTERRLENHQIELRNDKDEETGTYDWQDYWYAGVLPAGLVHRVDNHTVFDTLLTVSLLPNETQAIDPTFELGGTPSFDAGWDGNNAFDFTAGGNDQNAILILDLDNNGYKNDMIIVSPYADTNKKKDNGVVYVIMDYNQKSGMNGLANVDNFTVAFAGPFTGDQIGRGSAVGSGPASQSLGIQILNTDGNTYANDLLIVASAADANTKTNNGAIWLIKDVERKRGFKSLLETTSYDAAWYGAATNDAIGATNGGVGVIVGNTDGNIAANDLIVGGKDITTGGRASTGAVYLVMDINTKTSWNDFNKVTSFHVRFDGNSSVATGESIGGAAGSPGTIQLVNIDGNVYANDLMVAGSLVDYNLKADSGAVYIIKDINRKTSGPKLFSSTASFDLEITGGGGITAGTGAALGHTNGMGVAARFFDMNGDGFVNDLVLTNFQADFNGKGNNGAIWLIADVNARTGVIDLNRNNNDLLGYTSLYYGGATNDQIGGMATTYGLGGPTFDPVQIVNLDGNKTANDMLIGAPAVDFNAIADAGGVYLIKDINAKFGIFDLNNTNVYDVSWMGATASDFITQTDTQFSGLQLVNIDNNLYANDLLIGANMADINGKTNSGAVYLLKDINNTAVYPRGSRVYLGNLDNVGINGMRWNGGAGDLLSDNNMSGPSIQVINADGNAYPNDLLITASSADINGYTDNGAVYLILDIDKNGNGLPTRKVYDLNSPFKTYKTRISGTHNFDQIGDANRSGQSVIIANINNSASPNDVIILSPKLDSHKRDVGAVTLYMDINTIDGNAAIDNNLLYFHQWRGDVNDDSIGDVNTVNTGVQLVNADGNALANDLIIGSHRKDVNGLSDNGAVFFINDISSARTPVGAFTYQYNQPGFDGNSLRIGYDMNVSARVTCILANCGTTTTKLQYCYGQNCLNFMDMNTVSTSPLYVYAGTENPTNPNVTLNSTFDVNWTIRAKDVNSFMIRITTSGTTSTASVPNFDRWVVVEPVNSSDLQQGYAYSVKMYGLASDMLGFTNASFDGFQLVNVDNGSYANDVLIVAGRADVNGKTDSGGIWLMKNLDQNSGLIDLNHQTRSYSARWGGGIASDFLGDTNTSGKGFVLGDMDGNGYANDLLIKAPLADANSKTNAGAVYLIQDIDKKYGPFDLNFDTNYSVRWNGQLANDELGKVLSGGSSMWVADLDGNGVTNDLLIGATFADVNSKTDAGAIYMILDFNRYRGRLDLNNTNNFNARWNGGHIRAKLGQNAIANPTFADPIQLVNTDNNTRANDLLISAIETDGNIGASKKIAAGAVFYIKDINQYTGVFDLNGENNYAIQWTGGIAADRLGYAQTNAQGVQLLNLDGNAYANDLLITAAMGDVKAVDGGVVYMVLDIDKMDVNKTRDMNLPWNFNASWPGSRTTDSLGDTSNSGQAVQIGNFDNNVYANDLVLNVPREDFNSGTDNGAVYLILDINRRAGQQDLNSVAGWNVKWYGVTTNMLGDVENIAVGTTPPDRNGLGVQIVNADGNVNANDLLIGQALFDYNGKANIGGVFLIRDANHYTEPRPKLMLNGADLNFAVAWGGGAASDFLGDTNRSGFGFQLANIDGDANTNDLVLSAPYADVNGKTDSGAVYVIKNITSFVGYRDMADPQKYSVRYAGVDSSDFLGDTLTGGFGVQLVNVDGNASYTNDLLITGARVDAGFALDQGATYLIKEVEHDLGNDDLRNYDNFDWRWRASSAEAHLGQTVASGKGIELVNIDNGTINNDLFVVTPFDDINSRVNSGSISLIENISAAGTLDYTFAVLLPSSGCTNGKGNITGGTTCQRAWIETTDTNGTADESTLRPEGQSVVDGTTPFFTIDNQSTSGTSFGILLDLNQAYPANYVLKASQIYSGWEEPCSGTPATGCITLSTTPTSVGTATYSAGTSDLTIFFFGDFVAASAGRVDRNVDTNYV